LYKPSDFDPEKKYPVIEYIYPMGEPLVDHSFYTQPWNSLVMHRLAQFGFIVYSVDTRGTNGRSKAFRDEGLGMKTLIPDHVAALQQLGRQYPYLDLNRVGVYGQSGGGYATIRALLQAPDSYHGGVAFAPGIDQQNNTLNIRLHGLYEKNQATYREASLTPFAENLEGKLLIIQGTSDPITTFDGTIKLVDAFAKAGKRFDLIVIPGDGHGLLKHGQYAHHARRDYFIEHLQPVPHVRVTPINTPVKPNTPVTLHAKAAASAEARVLQVEFLVNGQSVGIDPEPPYEMSWTAPALGRHTISARVTDSSGRTEPSHPATLTVSTLPKTPEP
ncbi:MAG: prolyl oligopeptidase family serine peptidase, partial [Planctomycetota bacterium]